MAVRKPYDINNAYKNLDYRITDYPDSDKEENVNNSSADNIDFSNPYNYGVNNSDAWQNDSILDTGVANRVQGFDREKGTKQLAKEEIAKTTVENSEMYQGMVTVDGFMEATAGALSACALKSQESQAFQDLDFQTQGYNQAMKNVLGTDLEGKYHVDLTEDYGFKGGSFNVSIATETDRGAAIISENMTLSSENYLKALKGEKIEVRFNQNVYDSCKITGAVAAKDGRYIVDASQFYVSAGTQLNGEARTMTLQQYLTQKSSIKNRQDLISHESQKVSKALEHVGIHGADKMSILDLTALKNHAANEDVKTMIDAMIGFKQYNEQHGKTNRSKRNTKNARDRFFRKNLFKECDLTSGIYVANMARKIGGKLTKGALYAAHYASSKALNASLKAGIVAARSAHMLATEVSVTKLDGYWKLYEKVGQAGKAAENLATGYANAPQNIKEAKKQGKKEINNKINSWKVGKGERKIKRYNRRETNAIGRKLNRRIDLHRERMRNLKQFTSRFNPAKEFLGKAKDFVLSPFKATGRFFSTARTFIIKMVLGAAGIFLIYAIISMVASALFSAFIGAFCTVTAFEEDDNGITVGQNAVNKLYAYGGTFVRNASNKNNLSGMLDETGIMSGRRGATGGEFNVTLDESQVTCVYEDSSGNSISSADFYNVKEIMSSAEIHFMSEYTKDSYYEFTQELWEHTHSYYVEFSDVFYCDDEDNCDNWQTFSHTDNLDDCDNQQTWQGYGEDGPYEYNYCGGHSECGGHVKAEIHLVAERGLDELKPRVAEMADCMNYVPPHGWAGSDTDGIDYVNDTYFDEMWEVFMDIDWREEYNVSLGAGTFDASTVALTGETTQAIHDFLIECGYSEAGTAGIMGNWFTESGFNPTATNGNTFGIAQWLGGRKDNAIAFLSANGYDIYSLEGQLNFFYYEMATAYPRAHAAMMSATDPVEAASYFCACFEGCYASRDSQWYGNPDCYYPFGRYSYWQALDRRKSYANSYFNTYGM